MRIAAFPAGASCFESHSGASMESMAPLAFDLASTLLVARSLILCNVGILSLGHSIELLEHQDPGVAIGAPHC